MCVSVGGWCQGTSRGGEGGQCGQTGGSWAESPQSPVFHPLLKQKVCEAGNNSFLPLCVGDRLPVPAILRENSVCSHGCVCVCILVLATHTQVREYVCLCVSTCVSVNVKKKKNKTGLQYRACPKQSPHSPPDGISCSPHTHTQSPLHTQHPAHSCFYLVS